MTPPLQSSVAERLRKGLLLCAGFAFVALGALGVVLPLVPATVFFLLAAACFARSSQHFHDWLLGNRVFGPYIRTYRDGTGIPRRAKIVTIAALWLTIGFSSWFVANTVALRVLLLGIATAVTLYLARLPEPSQKTPSP